MSILRGYKSVVFILIFTTFASLGAGGCKEWWKDFCRYFSNRNKENNIDENLRENNERDEKRKKKIINEMKDFHTWTIFKITIIDQPFWLSKKIKNFFSNIYIDNNAYYCDKIVNNPNEEINKDLEYENKDIYTKLEDYSFNAFILKNEKEASELIKKLKNNENNGTNSIKLQEENNIIYENNNINDEKDEKENNINNKKGNINDKNNKNNNIINENNNNEENKKDNNINNWKNKTYYILVRNITPRKDKRAKDSKIPLFSALNENARKEDEGFTYTIEIIAADTTEVECMSEMFYTCEKLKKIEGLDKWDTGNVKDMSNMFNGCSSLESLDISNWDTKNVKIMNKMFYGCTSLQKIEFGDKWDISNVEFMDDMFSDCKILPIEIKKWDKRMKKMFEKKYSNTSITLEVVNVNIDNKNNLKSIFSDCIALTGIKFVKKLNEVNITDMTGMFSGCKNLKKIEGLNNWNTSNVEDMSCMFFECESLTEIEGLDKWNTSNVENMSGMFMGCSSLASLPDISKWNTSFVENMRCMFSGCRSLVKLPDISKWDTSNVTDIGYMFYNCSSLNSLPNISKWDTKNVIDMSYMFKECIKIKEINLSGWDTNNVEYMSSMFSECKSLLKINFGENWDIKDNNDTKYMFSGCAEGLSIIINKWNTNMKKMFDKKYEPLITLDIMELDIIDTKQGKKKNMKMAYMFGFCILLKEIKFSKECKTDNVTDMSYMFYGCINLTKIEGLNNLDTSNVEDMNYMFYNCGKLIEIKGLYKWNTSKVKNMSEIFYRCNSLTSLPDISKWHTENVTNMSGMFYGCSSLKEIFNANEIRFTVAKNCNTDHIHDGCTKEFWDKIKIEKK